MDTFLTIVFWVIQGGMAGLGVFVSLKPQPKEKHKAYIVAFLVLFVLGGAVNTIQTMRNGHTQDALNNNIRELRGEQKKSTDGITKVGGAVEKIEKNTQQPPVINLTSPSNAPRVSKGFLQLDQLTFTSREIEAGLPLKLRIQVSNRGQEPISDAYFYSVVNLIASTAYSDDIHKNFLNNAKVDYKKQVTLKHPGTSLGVGQGIWRDLGFDKLAQEQFDKLKSGDLRLYVFTWGKWKNQSGDLDQCVWLKIPEDNNLAQELTWRDCVQQFKPLSRKPTN